jgi:hypothetical protein
MELTQQPETEQEYWEIIEALGAVNHSTRRALSHGRISDPEGTVVTEVMEIQKIQERLVNELGEKFGILYPGERRNTDGTYPPAPEGKRWYWEWYDQYKSTWLQNEYNQHICSACPLSEGIESFSYRIPCSVFPGMLYNLIPQSHCGMLGTHPGDWTRERLLDEILKKGGEMAVTQFLSKETELQEREKTAPTT